LDAIDILQLAAVGTIDEVNFVQISGPDGPGNCSFIYSKGAAGLAFRLRRLSGVLRPYGADREGRQRGRYRPFPHPSENVRYSRSIAPK